MRWQWLLGTIVLILVGCGTSSTTVVTVVVTVPPGTPTPNAAATVTRSAELSQLATALAPTPAPTASPRPATTPSPSAGASAPASPAAAPIGALKVVEQGFGQNERSIGFAFVVENTDPKTAVDFSQYRVSAFDATGTVMRTEASYIPVIFPGQRIGIAGEFAIAQDARIVNVDFTLNPGRARPFDGQSPLTTANVVFQGNPNSGALITGIVKNAYAQDLRNVQVNAIAYDARGVIIGGGQKFIDRIPGGGGEVAADVTVTVIAAPARVELYATFAY